MYSTKTADTVTADFTADNAAQCGRAQVLDFDLTLNNMSSPNNKKLTHASYEKLLDEQGITHKHTRTVWDVLGGFAMVVCLMLLHPLLGYVYGVVLLLSYRDERLNPTEEDKYMGKMRRFFALARALQQPVLIVTRNTRHNVEYVLKRAKVEHLESIVILSDPSRERNKCEMVWDWMQNDCDAWCKKFAPKNSLLRRHEVTDHFPVVTFYDDSVSELKEIGTWVSYYDPGMVVDIQRVCRPGKHVVDGERVHRTYRDCVEQGLQLPGIFNQKEACVELWRRLSCAPDNCLPPPFFNGRWCTEKDKAE